MPTTLKISKAISISRLCVGLFLGLVSACFVSVAAAEETDFPSIPEETVDKYTVSTVNQIIESMSVSLLQASGRHLVFTMDFIDDHASAAAEPGVSLKFAHYANPRLKVDLISFTKEDFGYEMEAEVLRDYLAGIEEEFTAEQAFEIVEEPVVSTGPAKFRFLGQRALPLRYRFIRDKIDLTRAENWFEIDGIIHVIAIEAPTRFFDAYFESIRIPFNSSVRVGN